MEASPQNSTETTAPTDDADVDALMEKALSTVTDNAKSQADSEERRAAEMIRGAKAAEEAAQHQRPAPAEPTEEPQDIASISSRGRDYLLQRMREHQAKPKEEYVPPPMSDKMRERINEELEAGRRAQAKAQAQLDSRPKPDISEAEAKAQGTSTPVFRPNNMVPDARRGGLGPIRQ